MEKAKVTYQKRNEVLQFLSRAWLTYARNFPHGRNYEAVLKAIEQAQKAVFEEEER